MSVSLVFSTILVAQPAEAAAKSMKVHYIDTGQGDSIYIKTAAGDDIVIDAGNGNGSKTITYLRKQGVKDIEVLISTHPDADHMGGMNDVLHSYPVKSVYAPNVTHTTQVYKDFKKVVKAEGLQIKTVKKGTTIKLKGVKATFLAPLKSYSKSDLNNWSAVLKLTYGNRSFLFTGDAETKSEEDMINSKQNVLADVLKVGHHGAKTSTSDKFLKKVKPKHAVISVGKQNKYGHPDKTVLNRLKNNNVNVYRTDKQGSIVATTDGNKLTFNTKPSANGATTSTSTATNKLKASVSNNSKPKQYSTIKLNTSGLPTGTKYKAVFNYKSTKTTYEGKVGTPLSVKIGRAAAGYKVTVNVLATHNNKKTYKANTSFTPVKK